MEVSFSAFRIEALLSLSPPSALPSRPQPRQLSPGNHSGSSRSSSRRTRGGCYSVPALPRRELHPRLESAQIQPRSAGSSFLIRNILADCLYSEPGQAEAEAEEFQSGQAENTNESSASSDSESRAPGWTSEQTTVSRKKPRKARTAFSDHQLSRLERSFHRQKYLSVQERMELAAALKLSDIQVKTWYQNRRTKWKRQSAADLELLSEAGRLFLPTPYLCPAASPTVELCLCGGHTLRHTAPALLSNSEEHICRRLDIRGSEDAKRTLTLGWSNRCDIKSEQHLAEKKKKLF